MFQATVKNPVAYPTLEVALFGNDGAEFIQWATKVIDNGSSPVDSAKIILRAVLPVTYPFIGEREANRMADDYMEAMLRNWPGGQKADDYRKVAVLAFTAGLALGGRIGKLTVANAALTDGKSSYLLAAEAEGGVEAMSPLSRAVFGRPVGSEVGLTPKRYNAATGGDPLKGGKSAILAELLARAERGGKTGGRADHCADGSGRVEDPLPLIDELARRFARDLGPEPKTAVVGMEFRPGQIDQGKIEELFRSGGYRQGDDGTWYDPRKTDRDAYTTEGFTERPVGEDRATAGDGSNNFSTDKVGPLVTDGAKSEV